MTGSSLRTAGCGGGVVAHDGGAGRQERNAAKRAQYEAQLRADMEARRQAGEEKKARAAQGALPGMS